MDEVRILLNKLMGPQGPLSLSERHKFLGHGSGEIASQENTINDSSGAFYSNNHTQQIAAPYDATLKEPISDS